MELNGEALASNLIDLDGGELGYGSLRMPSVEFPNRLPGSITKAQHDDRLNSLKPQFQVSYDDYGMLEPAGSWDVAKASRVRDYWSGHFLKDSLFWVAALSGIHVPAEATKPQVIDSLVLAEVTPVSLAWVADAIDGWKSSLVVGEGEASVDDAGGSGAAGGEGQDGQANDGEGQSVRADVGSEQAVVSGGHVPPGPHGGSDTHTLSVLVTTLKSVAQSVSMDSKSLETVILNSSQRSPEAGAVDGTSESKYEKHLRVMQALVNNRGSVQLMQLSKRYLDELQYNFNTNTSTKIKLGGDLVLSSGGTSVPAYLKKLNPEGLKQGFYKYIELHMKSPVEAVRLRAISLTEFGNEIWSYPLSSQENIASFLVHFLEQHRKTADLSEAFSKEHRLTKRFLSAVSSSPAPVAQSSKPRKVQVRTKRLRHDDTTHATRRDGREPREKFQLCFSRLRKLHNCKYGAECKFSHVCPCCGVVHEGVDCSNWDEGKIDALRAVNKRSRSRS